MSAEQVRVEELTAVIREIQQRVRARHPGHTLGAGEIGVPDLMPLLHSRDAAEAKVAAIGTVNPRRGGLFNDLVQAVKRLVSRALDWHVREQVEFNRAMIGCVQAILEAFEENNRAFSQLAGHIEARLSELRGEIHSELSLLRGDMTRFEAEASELKDIRTHWAEWRTGWEEKLNRSEVYMLRTIAELNASFQHRATITESEFRQAIREQHGNYETALARAVQDVQQRLWNDLERIRAEYERLIYNELRVVRQKIAAQAAAAQAAGVPASPTNLVEIDWLRFADRFRGTEERVLANQAMYIEAFQGAMDVLDIGCGRGEFLEAARDAGIGARGIDLSDESIALCRSKGLDAEVADVFEYLRGQPDRSLGGVYCSQVIEHLPPPSLPELIRLIAAKLRPGSPVAFETPNPECLAIFATHFYIDPTHTRPVPAPLLAFYLEEAGFGMIEVRSLSPAAESLAGLDGLPESFRDAFFGGLDYAVLARKL